MLMGQTRQHMLMADPSQAAAKPNWRWRMTKPILARSANKQAFQAFLGLSKRVPYMQRPEAEFSNKGNMHAMQQIVVT